MGRVMLVLVQVSSAREWNELNARPGMFLEMANHRGGTSKLAADSL